MESPNNLEINGSLRTNPFAELLCEIADKQFNGSLRLARETNKIIVYFDNGEIVFVASNARQHRLFEKLVQAEKFSKEQLSAIRDYTNDLALRENLVKENLLDRTEIDQVFFGLINEILRGAIEWRSGEWTFSPLVRVKSDIRFAANPHQFLIEYARNSPPAETARRFKNPSEPMRATEKMPTNVALSPHESFVFSRFESAPLTVEQIESISGLPAAETVQILYALWLGGFVARPQRHSAFSEKQTDAIQSARLTVKKEAAKPLVAPPKSETVAADEQKNAGESNESETPETGEDATPGKEEISLEAFLERTENATNFYEVFALAPESAVAEIKQSYFALAKRFHPDLFYKKVDAPLLQRIQNAFSEIARAYETLKNAASRDIYDFKVRKELAERKEQTTTAASAASHEDVLRQQQDEQIAQAALNFEQGFDYLMEENQSAAEPFLARAAYYDKDNARYHAYYGKALAADNKKRHQAEAELQTAIKLDGNNTDYRIMLAEFFMEIGLRKRAEGELNRLLAIAPNTVEAKALLDSLKKK